MAEYGLLSTCARAAPDSGSLREMLDGIRGFDPAGPSHDECCRYYVDGSVQRAWRGSYPAFHRPLLRSDSEERVVSPPSKRRQDPCCELFLNTQWPPWR